MFVAEHFPTRSHRPLDRGRGLRGAVPDQELGVGDEKSRPRDPNVGACGFANGEGLGECGLGFHHPLQTVQGAGTRLEYRHPKARGLVPRSPIERERLVCQLESFGRPALIQAKLGEMTQAQSDPRVI